MQQGKVFVADGNKYWNRSSCGVVETAEMTAEMSHPDLMGLFGHHGKLFVRLDELEDFCTREGAPSPTKPIPSCNDASYDLKTILTNAAGGGAGGSGSASASGDAAGAVGGSTAHAVQAQPIDPLVRSAMVPSAVVTAQLESLQCANFEAAFDWNSQQNKVRTAG